MPLRGIRGATTVRENDAREIAARTRELVALLVERNGVRPEDVASAIFTVTSDLDAAFPTVAARPLPGWDSVPLLCSTEIPVPGSLGHCIRVLIHWNTDRAQAAVRHVFLHGARELRPEYAERVDGDSDAGSEERPVRIPGKRP
jgi:chorismate mutase